VTVYVDTSVVLRVLFREAEPLAGWGRWSRGYSSALWRVEALRTVDRARLTGTVDDAQVVQLRHEIGLVHGSLHVIPLTETILLRAAESFPTVLGPLDAIHLASALAVPDPIDAFLTHDAQLATAAAAMGFGIHGVTISG
jgi:predicted nucleic acid-binding protein